VAEKYRSTAAAGRTVTGFLQSDSCWRKRQEFERCDSMGGGEKEVNEERKE